MPRPGTNRYKKANKSNLFYNSFYGKDSRNKNGNSFDNINKKNSDINKSFNKKTLPKIKNNQKEERKNPGNTKNKIKNK